MDIKGYYVFFRDVCYGRHRALFTFILCGIVGVLVDIDHIPALLFELIRHRPFPGRILHPLFLLIGCIGCAYFGGLLYRYFLKYRKKNEKTIETLSQPIK